MLRYGILAFALLQLPGCRHDPEACCEDLPMAGDTVTAQLLDVGGASVQGKVFRAQDSVMYPPAGSGLHPTAVFLHNPPSSLFMEFIAQRLRLRGWNAITFYYRGTWESLGSFSLVTSMRTDIDWLVPNLRAEWAASSWEVAANRITLIGNLWGGGAALAAAARDPAVRCVAALAPVNIGAVGRLAGQRTGYRDTTALAVSLDWLRTANPGDIPNVRFPAGTTPELFVQEVIARAAEFDVTLLAPLLAGRPVLLVGTTPQELNWDSAAHLAPMRDALVKAGARVTDTIMNVRPDFSTQRTELTEILKDWLLREHCGG